MDTPRLEVFFDGDCPLCVREIRMVRGLDRKERIRFTDISAADFNPARVGLSKRTLMAEIHARVPSGELIQGVDVFREMYARVGLGPLVRLSRLPIVDPILRRAYRIFAANRLWLTGREACEDDACAVHLRGPSALAEPQ